MNSVCRLLIFVFTLSLFPAYTVYGAGRQEAASQENTSSKSAKDSKDQKEKKGGFLGIGAKKDEETKAAEQAQKYQELRDKAWAKYKDPSQSEFKQRVNNDYKEKRREHSEYAFQINTYNTNDERITYTGDKLTTEDTLYDNLLVQDYVNRVGQALVPEKS